MKILLLSMCFTLGLALVLTPDKKHSECNFKLPTEYKLMKNDLDEYVIKNGKEYLNEDYGFFYNIHVATIFKDSCSAKAVAKKYYNESKRYNSFR